MAQPGHQPEIPMAIGPGKERTLAHRMMGPVVPRLGAQERDWHLYSRDRCW